MITHALRLCAEDVADALSCTLPEAREQLARALQLADSVDPFDGLDDEPDTFDDDEDP